MIFKDVALRPGGNTEGEIKQAEASGQKAEENKTAFRPAKEAFLHWEASEKSTIDFDTDTVHFGSDSGNMEEFNNC